MEIHKNVKTFYAENQAAWREWLLNNHHIENSVWLIIYRKESGISSVYYPEAVDEALCFGWVDSTPNRRDNTSYYQFFAKRNPKSNWSKVNKEKVARLTEAGLMHESGLAMVELAKINGAWNALDAVENLILPDELKEMLEKNPEAARHWERFSRSSKRGILEWITNAKKPETRIKRIEETVNLAAQNKKANHPT
jgi:uncharacterized protein YdeI (YjbR/CyaY-like superfamily)